MDATSAWRNRQVAWLLGTLGRPRGRFVRRTLLGIPANDDQEKRNDDADEARNERVTRRGGNARAEGRKLNGSDLRTSVPLCSLIKPGGWHD